MPVDNTGVFTVPVVPDPVVTPECLWALKAVKKAPVKRYFSAAPVFCKIMLVADTVAVVAFTFTVGAVTVAVVEFTVVVVEFTVVVVASTITFAECSVTVPDLKSNTVEPALSLSWTEVVLMFGWTFGNELKPTNTIPSDRSCILNSA